MFHYISNEVLLLEQLNAIIEDDTQLKLSEEALLNIEKCEAFWREKSADSSKEFPESENADRLLRQYACGIGQPIPRTIVRLMLFLKIQSFSYGFSGVRLEVVQRLIQFYNAGALPIVYSQDIPDERIALAHLALPLIGEGELHYQRKTYATQEIDTKNGWQPLTLNTREVEALLNGTQLTTAYSVYNLLKALRLVQWADFVAAVSTSVFGGNLSPFSELMQIVRPHKGLIETAEHLRTLLKDTPLTKLPNSGQSMPEAFCSIPQIHGAVREAIAAIRKVVKTEINSVTDNPILFPEQNQIIFGGNSHTLPLTLAMDFLAITLTSLGNISERRLFFLLANSIQTKDDNPQYALLQRIVEGLLNENRRLSTPASIESPILFEKAMDIKGMGGSGAIKCLQVLKNVEKIIAIELLLATSLCKKEDLSPHSPLFKDYLAFLGNETTTLKINIEQTLQFFNDYEFPNRP
nr:aromatic amino acid ammonia-lyase [uncultured Capnocytophaga sp.]